MPQDWIAGLIGGLMIGAAAALYLLVNGRIMGASGIVGGLADGSGRKTRSERICFLAGLAGFPAAIVLLGAPLATHVGPNPLVLVAGGLLVGVGTRLANGCTSGHGVCGLSRLSPGGIVATVFYLIGGAVSVLIFRHALGAI